MRAARPMASSVTFKCHWCERTTQVPFNVIDFDTAGGFGKAVGEVAPDPWNTVLIDINEKYPQRVDCCPDCFESNFPPRVVAATET